MNDPDPGVTVTDDLDTNLVATSNWSDYINQSTQDGVYDITYSVTDSHDNTVEVTRQVVFINEANYDDIEEISNYQENAFLLDNDFYTETFRNNGYATGTYINDYHPDPTDNVWSFSTFFRLKPGEIDYGHVGDMIYFFDCDNGVDSGWYFKITKSGNTNAGNIQLYSRNQGHLINKSVFIHTLDNNLFHHIAFTFNNGVMNLYLDGVSIANSSNSYFTPDFPNPA